jgi:CRISPR-associated protein Cmr4
MKAELIKITALTNLHAGSSDISYGVVDKLVQRDPLTLFPVIHASGLKGTLLEYFKDYLSDELYVPEIFGTNSKPGLNKFFSAHLLTIPARSNVKPWFNAACPALIKDLQNTLEKFGFQKDAEILGAFLNNISDSWPEDFILFGETPQADTMIEDWNQLKILKDKWDAKLEKWFGMMEDFVLLKDEAFMELCENLPVVARNRLDEPRTLWYEELVPRQSAFFAIHFKHEEVSENPDKYDVFNKIITNKIPLQIGANASVGMGYCSIELIPEA